MDAILNKIMEITIVIFMVGNLLEVGLRLEVEEAREALHNVRFVAMSLVWCFVLGPALAILLTKILPLSEPYALGLVLLGLAPCSPAIPIMVRKAHGSLAYMSAFMLMAYVGTVVLMPLLVPVLAEGFTADPWTIAKPLLFFIAIPMVLGICTRNVGPALATLMGVADAPQGAITMCILAIFLGAILSGFAAAAVLKRYCAPPVDNLAQV
jgi:BASS family bile acid:Na+ symporter